MNFVKNKDPTPSFSRGWPYSLSLAMDLVQRARRYALFHFLQYKKWSRFYAALELKDPFLRLLRAEQYNITIARCYRQVADELAQALTVDVLAEQMVSLYNLVHSKHVKHLHQQT